MPHHIVQRGNRKQRIFFNHGDCRSYVEMLAHACAAQSVRCLAWCLMPNHVHLVLQPPDSGALRAVMSSVHTRYAQRFNGREEQTGHLFQDRYRSYPMSEAHLLVAVRYVENNPVKAGLAAAAEEWRWSSARAHLGIAPDPLTDVSALAPFVGDWRAYLRNGVEAADGDERIELALRNGRMVKGPVSNGRRERAGVEGTVPPFEGQSLERRDCPLRVN